MDLGRLALGWGLCIILVLAAVTGAEGREDGSGDSFSDHDDLGPSSDWWGRNLYSQGPLDATPTPTMAPPTDTPEVDAEDTAAAEPSIVEGPNGVWVTTSNMDRAGGTTLENAPVVTDAALPHDIPSHPTCGSTWTCFFWGYYDADGQYPTERIDAMINCESSWRVDPLGYHLGLAQFDPDTWWAVSAITGLSDWLDPYQQGYNVAVWVSMINPGTTAGWPSCWWVYGQ